MGECLKVVQSPFFRSQIDPFEIGSRGELIQVGEKQIATHAKLDKMLCLYIAIIGPKELPMAKSPVGKTDRNGEYPDEMPLNASSRRRV